MLASLPYFKLSPQERSRFREKLTPPIYLVSIMLLLILIVQYLFVPSNGYLSNKNDIHHLVQEWPQKSGLAHYPSAFTRDIIPKQIHSHNDYWRKVPFYSAIEVGTVSVEADVWVRNGDLLVGHDESSLTINRTFRSLYINPIMDTLKKQNPSTQFANNTRCGIFDTNCYQTLYLWVDLKTSAEKTWPLVDRQLGPLREGNWLTKWDGELIIPGPVTVVGTGSSSYEVLIANKTTRDYFIDAPLNSIGTHSEPMQSDGVTPLYDNTTSVFASGSLFEGIGLIWAEMSAKQKEVVDQKIKNANERGIEARFWDTPAWPATRRRKVWRTLVDMGVGLLNVDDLEDAAFGDW